VNPLVKNVKIAVIIALLVWIVKFYLKILAKIIVHQVLLKMIDNSVLKVKLIIWRVALMLVDSEF